MICVREISKACHGDKQSQIVSIVLMLCVPVCSCVCVCVYSLGLQHRKGGGTAGLLRDQTEGLGRGCVCVLGGSGGWVKVNILSFLSPFFFDFLCSVCVTEQCKVMKVI